jgi:hypothetical protein
LDRLPTRRTPHQIAALYEAIEGHADVQFTNIAPEITGSFQLLQKLQVAEGQNHQLSPQSFSPWSYQIFHPKREAALSILARARQAPRGRGRPLGERDMTNTAARSNRPWLANRKVRRQIPHRMESCEYAAERNKYARDGLWKIGGSRQVVYAKRAYQRQSALLPFKG